MQCTHIHTHAHVSVHCPFGKCSPVTRYSSLPLTPLEGQDSASWGNRLSKPIKRPQELFLQLASSSVDPEASRLGAKLADRSPRLLSPLLRSSCPSCPADGRQRHHRCVCIPACVISDTGDTNCSLFCSSAGYTNLEIFTSQTILPPSIQSLPYQTDH